MTEVIADNKWTIIYIFPRMCVGTYLLTMLVRFINPGLQKRFGGAMPAGKWTNLSVTHETRARLEELRSRLGFKTWDDLITMLLEVYEEHKKVSEKLEEMIKMLRKCLEEP